MTHDSTTPDSSRPDDALGADTSTQDFLDEVFERAVRLVEDGLIPEIDALVAGHEALRTEVERLVHLARHVAVGSPEPLPTLAGFTLLQQLGQGGMGTVYLARQHSLGGRPVALKVLPSGAALSPRSRARFLAEASAIARLRHPNIVAVHDVVHQDEVYAYAMEWIDGFSLAEVIDAETMMRGRDAATKRRSDEEKESNAATPSSLSRSVASSLSIPEACRIGLAIARALEAVHAAGLLHRDVKPSNILLRRDGTPLLADFGLARELDSSVYTQAGHFAGTVAYAPPEQLRGDAPSPSGRGQGEGKRGRGWDEGRQGEGVRGVRTSGPPETDSIPHGGRGRPHSPASGVDARSDIYALGVTLYHALALRLPFEARNPATMLRRIESGAATPLRKVNPRVPRDLETIVAKAMEADPLRRYQTAAEMADDLERFTKSLPIHARRAGPITRAIKLVRRNRAAAFGMAFGGLVALGLAAAAVTYVFFLPGWVAGHVREARLALLDPIQANGIASSLIWGAGTPGRSPNLHERRAAYERALAEYDAALRLSPYDASLQAERAVVRLALEEIDSRDAAPVETTDFSLRNQGLYAFLIHDSTAAIKHWSAWEKARDPLTEPDALVDAALGVLYLFDDQAGRAYPRLQKAVEAFPGVGFLMEYLADAAAKCGDAERARRWLEESKKLPRRDPLGAAGRIHAGLLAAEGHTDEAIAAYRALTDFGPPQLELARLLAKQGNPDAVREYVRLVGRFPKSARVAEEYCAAADDWWNSLSGRQRRALIRTSLDDADNPASLVTMLRNYIAALPRADSDSPVPSPRSSRRSANLEITNLKYAILTALYAWLSSPPLESLSLNELAERMEVENMALWSRVSSYSDAFRQLQFAAWRWPAMRSVCRKGFAFDNEQKGRQRLSRLAAMSVTVVLAGVTSQPANAQCTTPPCFQGLGDLPGGIIESSANGLSSDGSTVVGESKSAAGLEAFRWRADTGILGLGDLPGGAFQSKADAVSADGSVVVGDGVPGLGLLEGFVWTQTGGMVGAGDRPGGLYFSDISAISDDAQFIGGASSGADGAQLSSWSPSSGWTLL